MPAPDEQVAERIARAVAAGRPADRTPTVEQVLAAFGEDAPTPQARARAARALALAGVSVAPALEGAPAGSRVTLDARPRRRAAWWPLALVAGVLALALGAAIALAARGSDDEGPAVRAPAPPPRATVTLPAETVTVTTAAPAAPKPRPRPAKRRHRKPVVTTVRVRVTAAAPTFLCVEDGHGRRLFDGTLSGTRSFRARVVSLNVGLASTRVLANGRPVRLAGSPTGVRITRRSTRYLPLGARPCA